MCRWLLSEMTHPPPTTPPPHPPPPLNDIIQVDETETISIAEGDLYEEKNVVNIM